MADDTGNIYAPTEVRLDDVRADGDVELASRWSRLGAALVDTLILGVPFYAGYFVLLDDPLGLSRNASTAFFPQLYSSFVLFASAFLLYAVINWLPLERSGQTWGKKLLSIRIVRTDGTPVDAKRVLLMRYLPLQTVVMIPYIGNLFGLINTLMIFRESRKCIHDNIADTIVVKA